MLYGYDRTKHSCALMERTLGGVESRVQNAAQMAVPVYEHYCQPPVDAVVNFCYKGVENTKYVLDVTKSAAVTTSMIGIGAAVVAAQLSLALGVAGANLLLDSLIISKRIGGNMLTSAKDAEKAMEQRFFNFIQQAQGAVQVPMAKLSEQANCFLDIANAVVDRVLGLNSEVDPPECTVGERLTRLGRRLSGVLTTRAHDEVIDPLYNQMNTVMEQLAKSMILVDMIREQQAWAIGKAGELHTSVIELKERVEREAQQLKQKPEEILMRSLRHSSAQLTNNLLSFKDKGSQVFSESANAKLDAAVSYFGQLDENLAKAGDIYTVKDEILNEARDRLSDLAQWTSGWLVRDRSSSDNDEKIILQNQF
ncbi:unnamed protein product [Toxocara canis]|uniref:Apolipoprotein L3 n=1 Tax=Toxocara canis TaxID=6265 RepID=A0A183TXB6_TOXCA|nr:unnamed protein product [Toxocara canis]